MLKKILIMKKLLKIFLLFYLLFSTHIIAAEKGDAEVYKVTMTRVELCEGSTCSTPTALCTTSKTVDIASVNAGADIGAWCPLTGLTMGKVYTHVRVHVERTFTLKGYVENRIGDKECFTQDNDTASYTTVAPGGLSNDADTVAARVEQSMTVLNANGVDATSTQGDDITYDFTNSTDDRPINSTAWCFGTSSTHASNTTLCTDANGDSSSTTWDDNASADTMQIIYPFSKSYTVGPISPKLTIAFSTKDALNADQSSATTCELRPGSPTVTFTIK